MIKGVQRLRTAAIAVLVVGPAMLMLVTLAAAAPWSNPATIEIRDAEPCGSPACEGPPASAVEYPSTIDVSGEPPNIAKLTVTINSFAHTFPDDVDILLVGPTGRTLRLMSDAGGGINVSNEVYVFDDTGPPMPDSMAVHSGTYRPTNYTPSGVCQGGGVQGPSDVFNDPAPGPPYGVSLAEFNGSDPNGTWNLYVVDDCTVDAGSIVEGWSLEILTPTAVKVASFRGRASPGRIDVHWHTGSETSTLGYNVFRSSGRTTVRINRALVPAKASGEARGGAYAVVDRELRPGASYTYRLQIVALDGSRSWAGSTSLRAAG
jgi:hypothetical protein